MYKLSKEQEIEMVCIEEIYCMKPIIRRPKELVNKNQTDWIN